MDTKIRRLLQDADPLLHEAPLSDTKREQLRLNILRDAAIVRSTRLAEARRNFAAAIGMVMVGVMALGYGIWVRGTTTLLAAVRFEVRLAEDKPVQGLVVAQVADSGRLIYLHPEIVVSNDDVAQSSVSEDGSDRFSVIIQLLPSGADRMRQATALHVGRPMAILIDGRW
jgi:SecDF, P1 head subdomain